MINITNPIILSFTVFILIGCASAVTDTAQPKVPRLEYKDYAEYSPFFAHQGDTVYVSGDATQWLSQLKQTLFYLKQLRKDGVTYSDPTIQKPVSHIVFVNSSTPRYEDLSGVYKIAGFMRDVGGVSTSVIGDCGAICTVIFLAGKERTLGQDLNGQAPRLLIQPPTHHKTGELLQAFPKIYLAAFEHAWPKAADHRELMLNAITKPTDRAGGLTIGLNAARLCTSASSCQELNINMRSLGMLTSNERQHWKLPKRFPAPDFSQPSPPEVLAKPPSKNPTKQQIDTYNWFLSKPLPRALSATLDGSKYSGYYGGDDTAAMAIKWCQEKFSDPCKLIGFNNTIF